MYSVSFSAFLARRTS